MRGMTLNEYLRLEGLSDAQFAMQLGRDRTTVSRWRRGLTRPEWADMQAIAKSTNGFVNPNDFLTEPEAAE
jgi:transcriptional regulator with XRE-family HTH domain